MTEEGRWYHREMIRKIHKMANYKTNDPISLIYYKEKKRKCVCV